MRKFILVAVATVVTGLAGTALEAREAPKPVAATSIQPTTRICVVQPPVTGSYLNTKTCKTAAEWQKEGVDPVKLVEKKL